MLLVPQHKQNWQFLLATLPLKGDKKLVSRCQLLCLSLRFSFAHAWIFYQRGLIRIKCLKAFQTPGDLNNFWLDLQTKQTIMMQACVKMYTAVKQQMPVLDVFINVFSFFSSAFFHIFTVLDLNTGITLCLLLQRCKEKGTVLNSCTKMQRNSSVPAFQTQISLGRLKEIAVCSMQDIIKNIQISLQSVGGKRTIQQRCIFLGRYNKPPATPATAK